MKNNLDILEIRNKFGLTQQELANLLEVDRKYISMIETGVKPLSNKLARKLERLKAVDFHKKETSWTKTPDGEIKDPTTTETGNPLIPLPSDFGRSAESGESYLGPKKCPYCYEKDNEIKWLRETISRLQNNFSVALDALKKHHE